MDTKPTLIGIAGGSCSGKTTLARNAAKALGPHRCSLIAQDNYYFDVRILCPDGGLPDFDAPTSLEFSLLARHLAALKQGDAVDIPTYDFTVHQRREETVRVEPRPIVILEGILILSQPEIRAQLDHSVFLRCEKHLRLARRIARDVAERGRTEEGVLAQFYETVEPSQTTWVDPSSAHASRVIEQDEYLNGGDDLIKELIAQWTASK
ncbi:MAG: uridine kinase [Hellea sp.]|nr:uridine kinase [Hellea sp.]